MKFAVDFKKRIYLHKRDFQIIDINHGLFKYYLEINYKLNFKDSLLLIYIHDTKFRKNCRI